MCGGSLLERGAFCPGCGEDVKDANAFCPGCGTNLQEPKPGTFCPQCGHGSATGSAPQQNQGPAQAGAVDVAASVNQAAEKVQAFASQAAKQAGEVFKDASENGVTIKADLPFLSSAVGCAVSTIALLMPWAVIDWNSFVELGFSIIGFDAPTSFSILSLAGLAMRLSGYGELGDTGGLALAAILMVIAMIAAIVCMVIGLRKVHENRAQSTFLWIPTGIIAVLALYWLVNFGIGGFEEYVISCGLTPAPFIAVLATGAAAFLPNWLLKKK